MIFNRIAGFLIGAILTVLVMYYVTWGKMGMLAPGDLWGLVRLYSIMGGVIGAWQIGNLLERKSHD